MKDYLITIYCIVDININYEIFNQQKRNAYNNAHLLIIEYIYLFLQ